MALIIPKTAQEVSDMFRNMQVSRSAGEKVAVGYEEGNIGVVSETDVEKIQALRINISSLEDSSLGSLLRKEGKPRDFKIILSGLVVLETHYQSPLFKLSRLMQKNPLVDVSTMKLLVAEMQERAETIIRLTKECTSYVKQAENFKKQLELFDLQVELEKTKKEGAEKFNEAVALKGKPEDAKKYEKVKRTFDLYVALSTKLKAKIEELQKSDPLLAKIQAPKMLEQRTIERLFLDTQFKEAKANALATHKQLQALKGTEEPKAKKEVSEIHISAADEEKDGE